MNTKQTVKGFIIIEVVLVLAIAGLIFLMVFVALPALQAGQRDTARKNDVGSAASAVNSYVSAKRGALPPNAAALGAFNATSGKWSNFLEAVSGNTTVVGLTTVTATITPAQADGTINIYLRGRCGTVSTTTGTAPTQQIIQGTARQYAVVTRIEAGGGTTFCQDS